MPLLRRFCLLAPFYRAPRMVVSPTLGVMIAAVSLSPWGDAWRDLLDPRTRVQLEVAHPSR